MSEEKHPQSINWDARARQRCAGLYDRISEAIIQACYDLGAMVAASS